MEPWTFEMSIKRSDVLHTPRIDILEEKNRFSVKYLQKA